MEARRTSIAVLALGISEPLLFMAHTGFPGILAGLAIGAGTYYLLDDTAGEPLPRSVTSEKKSVDPLGAFRLLAYGKPKVVIDEQAENVKLEAMKREVGLDDDIKAPQKQQGIFLFSEILRLGTPTPDRIYIGTTLRGKHIFCTMKELCHVALAGATDAGKSSLMRMLVAQLCYISNCYNACSVLMLNPHWSGYILDKQEDWTPIIPHLRDNPMETRKFEVIEHYLDNVANNVIPLRLERFAHSKPVGKAIFLVLDELPAIMKWAKKNNKDVAGHLDTILKEGRKCAVYLISAAQDFLVDTLGGTGAVRDCYRTAYSVGGDNTTTKKLLGTIESDKPLGKGVVLLRNASSEICKEAVTALVPYVDNESLYALLGPSTYVEEPEPEPEIDDDSDDELSAINVAHSDLPIAGKTGNPQAKTELATIKPVMPESKNKATDFHIDVLCAAWNGGINTVDKIEAAFKMSHREAYKAYQMIKDQRHEPVEEKE